MQNHSQRKIENLLSPSHLSTQFTQLFPRLIKCIINKTGKVIDSQNEVGGWDNHPSVSPPIGFDADQDGMSDAWERKMDLNPDDPADGNKDHNNDGFTNLEQHINSLAHQ